jgi:AcrR family transcriptional regulator
LEKILSKREINKIHKKELFLAAAEQLFIHKGFENTAIDEIAKEAGMTKKTLYQYFVNKEDLFSAIALRGANQLFSAYEEAMSKGENTLEKIRLGNRAYLQFYLNYPEMFQLLNYQPNNKSNLAASPNFQEIKQLDSKRMSYFLNLMAAVSTDSSINPKLDTTKSVFFAFFAPFSLLYTISSLSMWELLELGEKEFLQFSFDLMVDALKP